MAQDGGVVFTYARLQRVKEQVIIGMTVMDSRGHLLHAFGIPVQFFRKVITAEALEILEVVEKALYKD